MKLRIIIIIITALCSLPAAAQWQKITPRESHPVPSDGSTVNFPTVSLPVGMSYHIHTDGRVNVSSGSDIADACYYVNIFSFNPTITPVAMKVKYGTGLEDWVWSFLNPKNYQSSHIYDLNLASASSPLSFRFFDRADPPSVYYSDNSGSINVEVAQETPALVAKYDTIYFNNTLIGSVQSVIDSVETYGLEAYQCYDILFNGPSVTKFGVMSENTVPFSLTSETTNWLNFSYSPTSISNDTAYFHLLSSNVYAPQHDFVIVLIGSSTGAKLSNAPDTLDFGTIKAGTTKQLQEHFYNSGSLNAAITSMTMTPSAEPFSATPVSVTVNMKDSALTLVTFAPASVGNYFARFDCQADDGKTLTFYAKGVAGAERIDIADSVLDFGTVILGQSATLRDTIYCNGSVNTNVINTINSNPAEYSVIGPQGAHLYSPGTTVIYAFTFKPDHHLPGCQDHPGSFTFFLDDGTSKTIRFKGCDHQALLAHLFIDTNYFVNRGKSTQVFQSLLDDLDSTLSPTRSLQERIGFDATLFDLVSVAKGPLVNTPDWNLVSVPGNGYVDITLSSATNQFHKAGTILVLTFNAFASDTSGVFTMLPQRNIDFSNPLEPLYATSSGKIVVTDLCSPVNLSNSAASATYIEQNLPNPVTDHSVIRYHIGTAPSEGVEVKIVLFDAMGRYVRTYVDDKKVSGDYSITLTAADLPAGTYWYSFEAGAATDARSMLVVK